MTVDLIHIPVSDPDKKVSGMFFLFLEDLGQHHLCWPNTRPGEYVTAMLDHEAHVVAHALREADFCLLAVRDDDMPDFGVQSRTWLFGKRGCYEFVSQQ